MALILIYSFLGKSPLLMMRKCKHNSLLEHMIAAGFKILTESVIGIIDLAIIIMILCRLGLPNYFQYHKSAEESVEIGILNMLSSFIIIINQYGSFFDQGIIMAIFFFHVVTMIIEVVYNAIPFIILIAATRTYMAWHQEKLMISRNPLVYSLTGALFILGSEIIFLS